MGINIVDSEGKTKIRLDDSDQEKDMVVDEQGNEQPYNKVAADKEKEATPDDKDKPEQDA